MKVTHWLERSARPSADRSVPGCRGTEDPRP
jgi:hypothetical protein